MTGAFPCSARAAVRQNRAGWSFEEEDTPMRRAHRLCYSGGLAGVEALQHRPNVVHLLEIGYMAKVDIIYLICE
jgi:hypothetical protein